MGRRRVRTSPGTQSLLRSFVVLLGPSCKIPGNYLKEGRTVSFQTLPNYHHSSYRHMTDAISLNTDGGWNYAATYMCDWAKECAVAVGIPAGERGIFLFSTTSILVLGPTQPPITMGTGSFPGVEWRRSGINPHPRLAAPLCLHGRLWGELYSLICQFSGCRGLPRLTKIIRSEIAFVSRNELLEWPDRSCLLLYVSARIH